MRTVALLLALTLFLLTGCTWSDSEPGLFRERVAEETAPPTPPAANPSLPVVGETIWTSAEGRQVTTRIAVHAVRRGPGLTVLDWSITPLSAPDQHTGDVVPSGFDLGLERTNGAVDIALLDPRSRRVFRPLAQQGRRQTSRCLCTPIWAAQSTVRLGETRLLQIAFPPLPATVRSVDVLAATLPPFSHVPVSAAGSAPTATHPTDLARPADPPEPLTAPQFFETADGETRRAVTLRVDQVLASSTSTTVRWTLRSMTSQGSFLSTPLGPPLVASAPSDAVVSTNALSGPTLAAPGHQAMSPRWASGRIDGSPFLECQCTNLDFWAIGLRTAGGAAQLVSTYPALPRGTDRVDIVLPGTANLTGLTVTPAPDGATRVGPDRRTSGGTWSYDDSDPPLGWGTAEWPTPIPDPRRLADYDASIDRLVSR